MLVKVCCAKLQFFNDRLHQGYPKSRKPLSKNVSSVLNGFVPSNSYMYFTVESHWVPLTSCDVFYFRITFCFVMHVTKDFIWNVCHLL